MPQRTADARVFYYHCDQIGTPLMMTDDVGDVVWEASYKAWGEARKVIERASKAAGITPRNPIRFQGQQRDEETGLSYNRYRYYDPSIGRFVSADPIKLIGGINCYQYAPSPIRWIDPLGLSGTDVYRAMKTQTDGFPVAEPSARGLGAALARVRVLTFRLIRTGWFIRVREGSLLLLILQTIFQPIGALRHWAGPERMLPAC